MTTLVTGATGFIGARLVEELIRRGETVHVLCRPTSDTSGLKHDSIVIYRGDLSSHADVTAAMRGCDRVYHLAAFAKNWASDEAAARKINIEAVRNIFAVARERGVQRVVYTSTIMTYGPSNGAAVSEKTVRSTEATNIYEQSKLDAEDVVADALRTGLDVVVVHPTRVFGPGKLTQANSTTILMKQYVKGTWRTIPGSGDAVGNYVYVDDVVQGCIAAMERAEKGSHFILGGANLTFSELFELLAAASGKRRMLLSIPKLVAKGFSYVELGLGKLGLHEPAITPAWVDVFYGDWMCSNAHAEKEIGYTPTPIDDAIAETIDWIRGNRKQEVAS
jgi:nucleoside-diphosphate-sugar epimerase